MYKVNKGDRIKINQYGVDFMAEYNHDVRPIKVDEEFEVVGLWSNNPVVSIDGKRIYFKSHEYSKVDTTREVETIIVGTPVRLTNVGQEKMRLRGVGVPESLEVVGFLGVYTRLMGEGWEAPGTIFLSKEFEAVESDVEAEEIDEGIEVPIHAVKRGDMIYDIKGTMFKVEYITKYRDGSSFFVGKSTAKDEFCCSSTRDGYNYVRIYGRSK